MESNDQLEVWLWRDFGACGAAQRAGGVYGCGRQTPPQYDERPIRLPWFEKTIL